MKKYEFKRTVGVDVTGTDPKGKPTVVNKLYRAGDVATDAEILPGCLVTLVRLGYVTEVKEADKPAPKK